MTTPVPELWRFPLRQGNSRDPSQGACLMDAVSWFEYGHLGDHPACVCPMIAAYAIAANDLLGDVDRQRLRPYILRLAGTYTGSNRVAALRCAALVTHLHDTIDVAIGQLDRAKLNARHICIGQMRLSDALVAASLDPLQVVVDLRRWLLTASQAIGVLARGDHEWLFVDPLIAGLDAMLAIGPQPPTPDPVRWHAALDSFDAAHAGAPRRRLVATT